VGRNGEDEKKSAGIFAPSIAVKQASDNSMGVKQASFGHAGRGGRT